MKLCAGLLSVILFFSSVTVSAEEVATLYSVQGSVEIRSRSTGSSEWKQVAQGAALEADQTIRTGAESRAGILFKDGILVRLNAFSVLDLKPPSAVGATGTPEATGVKLGLDKGQAYFISREPKRFPEVETSLVSGAIRGTEFVVDVRPAQVIFSVIRGAVELSNQHGSARLESGEQGVTNPGGAPQKRVLLNPLDAVQWALYIPPVISTDEVAGSQALAKLRRSAELLSAGQIEEAQILLEQVDNLPLQDSERALLWSQRSMLHLVRNEKGKADEASRKALSFNDANAVSHLVRSYVQQASFKLTEARAELRRAVSLDPEHLLSKVRLAELELSFGNVVLARALVEQALAQDLKYPYALTVRGFIALLEGDLHRAEQLFVQAAELDPSSGLSHLGLGLTLIRGGRLSNGRLQIEQAVSLEPSVSVYRSYLGKVFFEEEREHLAEQEYDQAKMLDPRDPTPYLYSAYQKLATFRPIEALWDIEDSIDRNNNRAVYRSSLLLDQDLGVRGAGLAQVFTSLDFLNLARVEATRSIARDFSNYSAHFLLSNVYDVPNLDQASISESLIGTLLAPVNFNALLPSAGGGASLNEYTALFDRPTTRTELGVLGQTVDQRIESSVVQLGSTEHTAYFLRYADTYADGFRDNDFLHRHLARGSVQYQVDKENKVLLEGAFSGSEQGDTSIGLNPEENDPDFEADLEDYSTRLGFTHSFSPRSNWINQLVYVRSNLITRDADQLRDVGFSVLDQDGAEQTVFDSALFNVHALDRSEGLRFDSEHIWDSEVVSLISGVSFLGLDIQQREDSEITTDDFELLEGERFRSRASPDAQAKRAFMYSTWHAGEYADFDLGVNYSHLQFAFRNFEPYIDDEEHESEWGPKIGANVYVGPHTTVRSAYFETISGAGTRDLELIEPTQVGGFNQVYDSVPGVRAHNVGIGIDHKFPKVAYVGAEYVHRSLYGDFNFLLPLYAFDEQGRVIGTEGESFEFDTHADENLMRTYWYQVLTRRLAATVDYDWVQLDDDFSEFQTRTHRVRCGLNYYDPSGWFAFTSGTWRYQTRDSFVESGVIENSDFWIFSGGVGYQFPHRHGFLQLAVRNVLNRNYHYAFTGYDIDFFPDTDVSLAAVWNF